MRAAAAGGTGKFFEGCSMGLCTCFVFGLCGACGIRPVGPCAPQDAGPKAILVMARLTNSGGFSFFSF